MDAKRKTAYRKILYNFLTQLKDPGIPDDASARTTGRYAGPVAYALHNLALVAVYGFVDFDEDGFWKLLASWDAHLPEVGFGGFRKMFERDLVEG